MSSFQQLLTHLFLAHTVRGKILEWEKIGEFDE